MIRIVRGIIRSVVAHSGELIRCVFAGAYNQSIEAPVITQYGISSKPKSGSDCIAMKIGSQYIIIATADRRYTIELSDGDVAIHTSSDQVIKLNGSGGIEIKSDSPIIVKSDHVLLGDSSGTYKLLDERIIPALVNHTHMFVGQGTISYAIAGTIPNPGPVFPFSADSHCTSKVTGA